MDLRHLLNGLKVRAPWLAAGRVILLGSGFVIHRGYDETIQGALREPPDVERAGKLENALREHLVAGEKLVRVVRLQPGERALLADWIKGKRKGGTALSDAFPGVASEANIVAAANAQPSSVGNLDLEVGVAALFTGARSYLDRVVIPPSKLKAGEADGYEKIYALRRVFVQTYDAIWLPDGTDVACLVTDLPLQAPSGFAKESQSILEVQLRRVLNRSIQSINMWPAVDGLYRAGEGRLVDYGFVNNSDAVKHHTSRRGGQSLRDDIYDKAGAAAVGDDLLLFKIAIAWPRGGKAPAKAQPELLLPGKAALLQVANARLDHAIVRNCLNTRDLSFVLSRLMPHTK